jgi:hypothetical protein
MHISLICLQIFCVSPLFKITDFKPHLGEEDELESRVTQMQ